MTARLPLALLWVLVASCTAPYSMNVPPSFKKYEDTRTFKLVSADGVLLKARKVKNDPQADLDFWVEAMKKHLDERGYLLQEERRFNTTTGHKACTLNFALPHGAQDWMMSETILVVGKRVVLVEAAAPFERFSAMEEELRQALLTFDPGQ